MSPSEGSTKYFSREGGEWIFGGTSKELKEREVGGKTE